MDVNVNAEVKGYGAQAVPVVEREDRVKPQVAPVAKDTGASKSSLNDRALHGRGDEEAAKARQMSQKEVEKVMEEVQRRLDAIGGNLKLSFDEFEETNAIVVQVKDKTSNELVRQFPSEDLLQLRAKLDDLIGLLFDESV